MTRNIENRLRALENVAPDHLIIIAEDRDGNQFECSIEEFEAHGEPYTEVLNGTTIHGREWGFVKLIHGKNSIAEALRVLDAIDKTFMQDVPGEDPSLRPNPWQTPRMPRRPRICEYGFTENADYSVTDIFVHNSAGGVVLDKALAYTETLDIVERLNALEVANEQ